MGILVFLFAFFSFTAHPCAVGTYDTIGQFHSDGSGPHGAPHTVSLRDLTSAESPIKRFPSFVQEIETLERGLPRYDHWHEQHSKLHFREYLGALVKERNKMADRMEQLSKDHAGEPVTAAIFSNAANRLRIPKSEELGYINLATSIEGLKNHSKGRHLLFESRGIAGELQVALSLNGVVGHSVKVKNGIPGTDGYRDSLRSPRILVQEEYENSLKDTFPTMSPSTIRGLLLKEIDVVFDNGNSWGEVKNYNHPLALSDLEKPNEHGTSLLDQAKKTTQLARALGNKKVYYFIRHGITPEAMRALEALGITVVVS